MHTQGVTWHRYRVSANISLLFTEVPYLERFAAAAAAGFTAVESWWPFPTADPDTGEKERLVRAIEDAGLSLTGMNVFAGDMAAGERGIACLPERAEELDSSLEALHWIAERTDCRGFNLLHGQVPDGDDGSARQAAVRAYRQAAESLADLDGTPGVILVEALARDLNGAYPLETAEDALSLLDEVGAPTVKLLLDTFHLGHNGVDMVDLIKHSSERIGHVQLADAPGRGEPGSGSVDITAIGEALNFAGYMGTVAAEYKPTRETLGTLDWLSPPTDVTPLA